MTVRTEDYRLRDRRRARRQGVISQRKLEALRQWQDHWANDPTTDWNAVRAVEILRRGDGYSHG